MKNIFLINTHHPYPGFSEGKLNKAMVERAKALLEAEGHTVKVTASADAYDVAEEVKKHQWADVIITQIPVNWMGVPWSFKKYMDEVYSAGLNGELCKNDGRSSKSPKTGYGSGGTLQGKKYMMSLTFNAPKEAFDNADEYLFQGKSVDDLFFPMDMNFRFFAMEKLPTFSMFDVLKNPTIEEDMKRFDTHLLAHI